MTAEPPEVTRGSAVGDLAHKARSLWRKHQPVAASLRGEPILDHAEDLSDAGLESWLDALNELDRDLAAIRPDVSSTRDLVLYDELGRAIADKRYQARVLQPYLASFTSYLYLIALGLLPFETRTADAALLANRLDAAALWLEKAEGRSFLRSSLAGMEPRIQALAAAVDSLVRAPCYRNTAAETSGAALSERLRNCIIGPKESAGTGAAQSAENVDYVLSACYGTQRGLAWWDAAVEERLRAEIARLNDAEGRGEGLQASPRWDPGVWNIDAEQEANALNQDAGSFVLLWTERTYAALRDAVAGRYVAKAASPVPFERASPLLACIVHEALFLDARGAAGTGSLVMARHFYDRPQPFSSHDRLYLALVVAHEVCPGHYEQLRRGSRSPLAEYGDFLYNPMGMEGWAVYAERAIADVDPYAAAVCSYHVIRRLMPAALALSRLNSGSDAATALLRDIVRCCPALSREVGVAGRIRDSSLVYAVGLIETERSLAELNHTRPRTDAHEAYLAQGPITPGAAVRLASAAADATTVHPLPLPVRP